MNTDVLENNFSTLVLNSFEEEDSFSNRWNRIFPSIEYDCNVNDFVPSPAGADSRHYLELGAERLEQEVVNNTEIRNKIDQRILTYCHIDGSENRLHTLMTACAIAERVKFQMTRPELHKLTRIKNCSKKLSVLRRVFLTKYGLPSITKSYKTVQRRMKREGKTLILLNVNMFDQLGLPIESVSNHSQLVVVLRLSCGSWFPASRYLVNTIVRRLMKN